MTRVGPNRTQTAPAVQIIPRFDVKEKAAHAPASFFPGLSLFYCVFSLYFAPPFGPFSGSCSSCGEINPSCQHFDLILQRVNQKKRKLIAVARYFVSGRWRVNSELIPELTDYLPIFPHTEPRGNWPARPILCRIWRAKKPDLKEQAYSKQLAPGSPLIVLAPRCK